MTETMDKSDSFTSQALLSCKKRKKPSCFNGYCEIGINWTEPITVNEANTVNESVYL